MKNSIWVSRSKMGVVLASFVKPKIDTDGSFKPISCDKYTHCDANIFGLDIEKGETVELIYDTETGEVEVKRPRENGWYLVNHNGGCALAMHWNGRNFCANRNKAWTRWADSVCIILSGKLPDNEYLRSLE